MNIIKIQRANDKGCEILLEIGSIEKFRVDESFDVVRMTACHLPGWPSFTDSEVNEKSLGHYLQLFLS